MVRIEVPDLRIVSDEQWQSVQKRFEEANRIYRRSRDGRLRNGPFGQACSSTYLLSGLAKCGICEKSIVGITRERKGHIYKTYGGVCY